MRQLVYLSMTRLDIVSYVHVISVTTLKVIKYLKKHLRQVFYILLLRDSKLKL